MHYRTLGRTGWKVSEISFGAWAIGGALGQVDDRNSLAALHRAIDRSNIARSNRVENPLAEAATGSNFERYRKSR